MVAVVAFVAPSFVPLCLWSAFLGGGGGFVWLYLQKEGDREDKGGSEWSWEGAEILWRLEKVGVLRTFHVSLP